MLEPFSRAPSKDGLNVALGIVVGVEPAESAAVLLVHSDMIDLRVQIVRMSKEKMVLRSTFLPFDFEEVYALR